MTTRDGLITSEFDDAGTFDDIVPFDEITDVDDLDDLDHSDEDDWDQEDEDDDLLDVDLELVVLGMAGTTVFDDGLVERAFEQAAKAAGAGIREIPGAERLIRRLRASGVKVALTTGSSQSTKDAVLDALGWRDLADVALSAAEAGRGRPFPDLPLTALLRTGASSVEGMVVVGDTASDIISGIAAGAGLVVGVLSGAHDEETLLDAGADAVIASVAELPALLGFEESPESLEAFHAHGSDAAAGR